MNLDMIFNIAGLIIGLAMVAVIVGGKNTVGVINATTGGFVRSIGAATAPAKG